MKSRHLAIASLLASLVVLSGCASEGAQPDTSAATFTVYSASPDVAASTEPSPSPSTMNEEEAADWYVQSVCIANTFLTVREAAYAQAEAGTVNVGALTALAPLDMAKVREAADALLNPPAPWPADVKSLINDRAALLQVYAGGVNTFDEVRDPDDFMDLWSDLEAMNADGNEVAAKIRSKLEGTKGTVCPPVTDPAVATALASLEEPSNLTLVSIDCYGRGDSPDEEFASLDEYWAAVDEGWKVDFCTVEVPSLNLDDVTKAQKKAMAAYSERFKGGLEDAEAYADLLENCVDDPREGFGSMAAAKATLAFCPETPYRDIIEEFAAGTRILDDGTYIVGEEISAGTWRTTSSVGNCYWERASSNGTTIANDFITFASGRVTVNVSSSDGSFITEGCGAWKKVG